MNLRNWIIGGAAVAAMSFSAPSAEARPWRGGYYYGRPAVRAYYGPSYGYGYRAYPGYYGRGYYGGGYYGGYGGGYYGRGGFYGPGVGIGIGLGPSYYGRW